METKHAVVEKQVVESSTGEYSREVWLLRGPRDQPHRLCLFLDAELYLHGIDALPLMMGMRASGAIPAMTYGFVSHVGGEARHYDYTCNDRYSRFIAEDVVAWAKADNPSIQDKDHMICGVSLSGLAATYLALQYPALFPRVLSQSGSFWWDKEWLTAHLQSLSSAQGRFWMSVGDKETEAGVSHQPTGLLQEVTQITGVENAARELTSLGASVRYQLYTGGHETAPWRAELPQALPWLTRA